MKQYHPSIKVDVEAMAKGLVEMIKTHPDGACFSFGMFPADLMEIFDRELARKVPDEFVREIGNDSGVCTNGKRLREQITKDVCAECLRAPQVLV